MSGRNEDILRSMVDGTAYTKEPKSRNEELLLELKDVIEAGGGFDPDDYYTKPQTDAKIADKVDKVTGKGLSTEDYTTAEKTKLAGLSNYDDTAISSRVDDLEDTVGDINTILEEVL